MTRNRKIIIGVVAALVLGSAGGLAYWLTRPAERPVVKKEIKKPVRKKIVKKKLDVCPLDGVPAEKASIERKPLSVMVENLISIRPQSGLSNACVVVEGLSEAGITRFMAIFGSRDSDRVGPVRSARKHFVAVARGADSLYGHAGGSIYALEAIKDWGVDDLDQFTYPQAYERVPGIKAPHNLFTNTNTLRKVKDDSGRSNQSFVFKPEAPLQERSLAQTVDILFKDKDYVVQWQYQRESNAYLRFNAGSPHMDALTNTQLAAKNIAVMYAATSSIPGGGLVLDVNMIGSGRLVLYRDGVVVEGTWEKPDVFSPIRFVGPDGSDMKLNPGQVWIEIVPPDVQVTSR